MNAIIRMIDFYNHKNECFLNNVQLGMLFIKKESRAITSTFSKWRSFLGFECDCFRSVLLIHFDEALHNFPVGNYFMFL